MATHELKTWPAYFEAVSSGIKPFELRRDDREFAAGDLLRLREYDPDAARYTGRVVEAKVSYVVRDAPHFGLMPGFAILGLDPRRWEPLTVANLGEFERAVAMAAEEAEPMSDDDWQRLGESQPLDESSAGW